MDPLDSEIFPEINPLSESGDVKTRFKHGSPSADDIRKDGWSVAVHNDYVQQGVRHTFWLFTKTVHGVTISVKGESSSDEEALDLVRNEIRDVRGKLVALAQAIIRESMGEDPM